jgi:uncharacterized membrane protein YfcA
MSALCAIHCVAVPIAIIYAGPIMARLFESVWMEWGFIIVCLSIAAYSFFKHKKQHNNPFPIKLFWLAFVFLIGSVWMPYLYLEIASSVIGSIALVSAHIINIRYCKKCSH